jgi:hypothetical protein
VFHKLLLLCALSLAACLLFVGQEDTSTIGEEKPVWQMFRPDAIIQVEEHDLGPEVVTIQMRKPDYPAELLAQQIQAIGRENNSNIRGLRIGAMEIPTEKFKFEVLTAEFATDDLIDSNTGALRMTPIIRAFAGAPEPHTIENLSIIFVGEKPRPTTLQGFADDNIRVAGRFSQFPEGLEYQVRFLTQDPEKISVPDRVTQDTQVSNEVQVQPNVAGIPLWLFISAIAALAICIGVIVYMLVSRSTR